MAEVDPYAIVDDDDDDDDDIDIDDDDDVSVNVHNKPVIVSPVYIVTPPHPQIFHYSCYNSNFSLSYIIFDMYSSLIWVKG